MPSNCPYVQGELYEIKVWDEDEEETQWKKAYYVGLDGDGDYTFHVDGTCRYESFCVSGGDWFDSSIREIGTKEPEVKGWVNVYKHPGLLAGITPSLHPTREEADQTYMKLHSMYRVERSSCVHVSGPTE